MEEPEGEKLGEAVVHDRKSDIYVYRSLISLIPTWFLWRQCAVFTERPSRNAQLPEGTLVVTPRVMMVCKGITIPMVDNARVLMVTRPFVLGLPFCFSITFCGTNLNLMLFDRNSAIF